MMKVFLGGTVNGSTWRDKLIPLLNKDSVDYFNPVVEEWTEECKARERIERTRCDVNLYVLTPLMAGVYSIAEVVDDSNKRPTKTVLMILEEDNHETFTNRNRHSIREVERLVRHNGGTVVQGSIKDLATYLNERSVGLTDITKLFGLRQN